MPYIGRYAVLQAEVEGSRRSQQRMAARVSPEASLQR
jgi:hypothetical protein